MTHWHIQVTRVTARAFAEPDGFEGYHRPVASVEVDLHGNGDAFAHAAGRTDGRSLTRQDWRGLGAILRDAYGIQFVEADRRGRKVRIATARA